MAGILECDTVLLGKWFLTFQTFVSPSSSRLLEPKGTGILRGYTGWSKILYTPDDYSKKKNTQKYFKQLWSLTMIMQLELGLTDGVSGPCYTEHGLREQSSACRNVWRLAGDTLNITCNFLYCNHQVHRDFLISLYITWLTQPLLHKIYV
jgi:hypothetical protein